MFKLRARRGNLIVTALFIVLGMMMVVGGVNTMLQNQVQTAIATKAIGLAKLQTFYVAEMALNQLMFDANRTANISLTPPAFPSISAAGTTVTYNFTNNVWMTRPAASGGGGDATSSATATVTCQTYTAGVTAEFRVDASLVAPGGAGTYTKRIDFGATYVAGTPKKWVLSSYTVY